MQKFKALLKEELSGWKPFDIIWLVLICTTITVVTLLTTNSEMIKQSNSNLDFSENEIHTLVILSIIAAIIGVFNVVLGGKGKLSNYLFGVVSAVLMIYINYKVKNLGIMLVSVYNLVMQFVGFFSWSKNMNNSTHEVKKIHMTANERLLYLSILAAGTLVLGFILKHFEEAHPFLDAFITVSQILAMILMVSMFSEQWWLWIGINVASIYIFLTSAQITLPLAMMYVAFFANSIVMCIRWEKEARENDKIQTKIKQ